jgi:zinc protease
MPKRHTGPTFYSCSALSPYLLILIMAIVGSSVRAETLMAGVVKRELPNGVTLLVREQHGAPLVTIDAWVRAGSGVEEEDESGCAHFLEHLLFKGTPTRKTGEIDAAIEDLGATLGAGTTRDGAHYYTTVATAYYKNALEVIGDALQNSVIDPAELERERLVILDEMARARNDVLKQATNKLFSELLPGQKYGRAVLGDPESLKELTRDKIFAFYRKWYIPQNLTLVLVGDLTPDQAEEAANAVFGKWPSGKAPTPGKISIPAAKAADTKPLTLTSPAVPAGKQNVYSAFLIEPSTDFATATAAKLAVTLLGDIEIGRIAKAIRDSEGLAANSSNRSARASSALPPSLAVSGDFVFLTGPTLAILAAQTTSGRPDTVQKLIQDSVDRLRHEAPTADEMDMARRRILGPYLYDIETYAGQARMLGIYAMLGDYTLAQRYADIVNSIKPADIMAFAQKSFVPERQASLILSPGAKP